MKNPSKEQEEKWEAEKRQGLINYTLKKSLEGRREFLKRLEKRYGKDYTIKLKSDIRTEFNRRKNVTRNT